MNSKNVLQSSDSIVTSAPSASVSLVSTIDLIEPFRTPNMVTSPRTEHRIASPTGIHVVEGRVTLECLTNAEVILP